MSAIDTLLDKAINNGDIVLTIDEPTREIRYTGELLLGVEGDCQAEKIYFEAPKTVGNFIDLQAVSTLIYVDFKTAEGEPYFIECGDREYHEDTNTVSFSWLLTERVTVKRGSVKFRVCVKTDEAEPKEWHTSIFTGKVLEGINVEGKSPEIVPDETITTYKLMEEVKALQARLSDIEKYADSVVNVAIVSKGYITKSESDSSYTSKSEFNETMETISDHIVTLNDKDTSLENQTAYKCLYSATSDFLASSDVTYDLSEYLENDEINELMIIVRTRGSSNIYIKSSINNNYSPIVKEITEDIVAYTKIVLNKSLNNNMFIWDVAGNVFPVNVEQSYIYDLLYIESESLNNEYPSFSIYGR